MYNFDPFTKVYQALLAAISGDTVMAALVQPSNIVDFTSPNPEPVKDEIESADLPELQLIPMGGPIKRDNTMKLTVEYGFSLQITTGDNRINGFLLPIQWAALRAIYAAGDCLGFDWVKQVRCTAVNALQDNAAQRGIEGWVSAMHIVVTMLIDNDVLESGNEPFLRSDN